MGSLADNARSAQPTTPNVTSTSGDGVLAAIQEIVRTVNSTIDDVLSQAASASAFDASELGFDVTTGIATTVGVAGRSDPSSFVLVFDGGTGSAAAAAMGN